MKFSDKCKREIIESFNEEHYQEKLEFLQSVQRWVSEFIHTPLFNRVSEVPSGVRIFEGHWEHDRETQRGHGLYSFVNLYKDGRLEYQARFKQFLAQSIDLNEENLQRIRYNYLRDLSSSVVSGKSIETIKTYLNLFGRQE